MTIQGDLPLSIRQHKDQLDQLRPLSSGALHQSQKHYDIELTYTSNAIEGNTLTLRETAEVIEHGITVGGKRLKEHLEAVDHYEAVLWMRELAAQTIPIGKTPSANSTAASWPAANPISPGSTAPTGAASPGRRLSFPTR